MKLPKPTVLLLLFALLAGCNEPPRYGKDAREFLQSQGISSDTINNLIARQPLEPDVAEHLSYYENVGVLHLVGANPGTPPSVIERLAKHANFEVRTGVAGNPNAPLDLLLSMRTVGKYTTVNGVIAGNPRLPQAIMWEMLRNGEAEPYSFASNPNCPPELMRTIAAEGDYVARITLASNPNIPEDVAQKLSQDKTESVRNILASNPRYGRKTTEPSR